MFRHMDYIYAVYQEKSVSKAAEKLYISQPSLSATIKKLENKIGNQLFDRSCTPLRLTPCGEEYIKSVERIRDVQAGFSNYLNDSLELKTGTITIGATNFLLSYILPPIIVAFKKQYPGVVVNLVEAESIRIQKLLFSGELDLIIDNYNYSESLYKKTLFSQETLLLAVPKAMIQKEHEEYLLTAEDIAKKKHLNPESKAVELSMFNGFPFIALRYGNDTRERLECIRKTQEFRPNVVLELDQLATAYHVACNGLGMTITSDTLVNETPADGRLVYFCLKSEEIHRENYFYYKQGKYVSQAMKVFMEFSANMTKNT